jgi:hypothetical protein
MGLQYPEAIDPRGLTPDRLGGRAPLGAWVTPDDLFVVGVRNSLAGVQLGANARIWHPDGSVGEINLSITPGTTRAVQFFSQQLHYGYLVHAAVTKLAGNPTRGTTLASLQVARPPVGSFATKWFLGQDYITGMDAVYWPFGRNIPGVEGPGFLRSVQVTNPAAGADWTQTVPAGARWAVRAFGALFTAGAAVGNRNIRPQLDDGVNVLYRSTTDVSVIANGTLGVFGSPVFLKTTVDTTQALVPIPVSTVLFAGWRIGVATAGILAADQWSFINLLVEEWLED